MVAASMLLHLVTAFLCVTALNTVVGLDCYRCTYLKMETSNEALSAVLKAFSKLSNANCKLATEEDRYKVDKRTCPPGEDGKLYKCVILNGTVTTSLDLTVTSIDFKYHTLTRDCVEVEENDDNTSNGCHTSLPSNGAATRLANGALQGLSVGDSTYKGTACYYDHLTAAAGHVYSSPAVILLLLLSLLATVL